jgi:hypothetical protein
MWLSSQYEERFFSSENKKINEETRLNLFIVNVTVITVSATYRSLQVKE